MNKQAVLAKVQDAALRSALPINMSIAEQAIDAGLVAGQTYITVRGKVRITETTMELLTDTGAVANSVARTAEGDGALLAIIALQAARSGISMGSAA